MPTYEYLCQACSHRFETWQKMTDEPLSICPECGGHIRRVLYPTGIIFKGSGFYKTDHSNNSTLTSSHSDSDSSATKTESADSTASTKNESAKSETKAAESTASKNGTSAAKTTTSSEHKTARAAAS